MLKPTSMTRVLEEKYGFEVRHASPNGIAYRFGSFEGVDIRGHAEMLEEHGYEMVKFEGNNTIVIEPI